MPVAQLTPSNGTIYTAKPTRALSTRRCTSKTSAGPSATTIPTTATAAETTIHQVSSPTTQSPDGKVLTAVSSSGTEPTGVITNVTAIATSSGSDGAKKEQELLPSKPVTVASGEEASEMVHPSEHPLVLSGRRVWVVSPVVGWASVWAETGQSILTPAGVDLDGKGSGNGENNGGERGSESSGVAAAGKGGGSGPGVGKSWKGGKWKGSGSGAKGGMKEEGEATGTSKAKMGKDGKGFDPSPSPVVKIQKTFSFPPLGYPPSLASAYPGPNTVVPPSQKLPKGNKFTHPPQSVLPSVPTNGSVAKTSPGAVSLETFHWQSLPPLMPTGASQFHASAPGPQAHAGPWPGSVNLSSHSTPGSGGPILDKTGFLPMGFGKETGNTGGGSGGGGQSPFAMLQWDIGAGGVMVNAEEEAKKTE